MIDPAIVKKFLSTVYPDAEIGDLAVWDRQTKHSEWFPVSDIAAAADYAARLAQSFDVYFTTCLHDKSLAEALWRANKPGALTLPNTRGFNDSAIALPGARVDLDVLSRVHKEVHLPSTVEEAWQFLLDAYPLRPTIVINSGHGIQAYWLFRELWIFASRQERAEAQRFLHEFLATLQVKAKAYDWSVDPTADLSRVLRLPGTVNRKLTPVPVTVLSWDEGNCYNPSDFEPYFIAAPQGVAPQRQHTTWTGPRGAVAPLLARCRFVQHCGQNAATLSEPYWYALLSNLARLDGGEAVAHALSSPYPHYTHVETEKKIAHALSAPGPHTRRYIQQQLGFTGCPPGGCGVTAPLVFGTSRRAVQQAVARERQAAARQRAQQRRASAIALAEEFRKEEGSLA